MKSSPRSRVGSVLAAAVLAVSVVNAPVALGGGPADAPATTETAPQPGTQNGVITLPQAPAGAAVPTTWADPPTDLATSSTLTRFADDIAPQGVNPATCTPRADRGIVLLTHGTDGGVYKDYSTMGPLLVEQGYCVYGLTYGIPTDDEKKTGALPADESLAQLMDFSTAITAQAPTMPVYTVGYSQGGILALVVAHKLIAEYPVAGWVGIATPAVGSEAYGLSEQLVDPSIEQFMRLLIGAGVYDLLGESPWWQSTEELRVSYPQMRYLTITSLQDQFIQPVETGFFPGADNIVLQQHCPNRFVSHVATPHDPLTAQLVADFFAGGQSFAGCLDGIGGPEANGSQLSPYYGVDK